MCDISCDFESDFFTMSYELGSKPTVTLFFIGTIKGEPRLDTKYVSEARWFSFEDALKLDMAFEHGKVLREYVRQRKP